MLIAPHRSLWIVICICLCSGLTAHGQSQQNAQFTQGTPGTNTMTLQIPLGSMPGRGINLPINLNYNSKVWRLGFLQARYWTANGKNSVAEAIYSEFATAGWATSLDVPVVEWPKNPDLYWYTGKPYANGSVHPYTYRVARVFIHMPGGSTHELRKADAVQPDTGSVDMSGTFYAVDGSRMRYDANGATNGVLYLPDGTRYNISSTTIQYIDTNGNSLTYNVASREWTDTMNRTIGMPWPASPQAGTSYEYSVPGLNGSSVTYTFKFAQLSSALSPNSPALKPVGDWYLPNPSLPPGNYNTANNPQPQSPSMFQSRYTDPDELDYRTYTQVIGRLQPGNTNFNPVVLTEVVLPNNLSYKFTYNNYGELDKIIYPSGAYQRYEYGPVPSLGYPLVPYDQASRGLKNRWLSASGTGTDEVQWNYSFESPSVLVLTAPGPTGAADGIRTKTYLHNTPDPQDNFGYDDSLNGLPYEECIYAPASEGGALLRRTLTKWAQSSGTYNRPTPGIGTYTATRNARPTRSVTMWLDTGGDALSLTSAFGYDTNYWWNVGLDRTSSTEYGFKLVNPTTAQNDPIDSIPDGPLLRITNTSYLTTNANYRDRNILGLPTYSSISDANGIVSQTSISYDESAYPLLSFGPVVGWNNPQTSYRGNPTTVKKWLNYPTATWIETHTQYDQYGNVRKSWDGMGRLEPSAELDYSAGHYYAYPTTISTIAPDPEGTHGQPTALVSTSVFDLNTGLVTSTTDPNGQTTSVEYNDPLQRQTKVTRADGGWTSILYNDDPSNTYIRTQTLQRTEPSQRVIESYEYFDKVGRSVRSFANEGSTYLTTDTQYDLLGRVWRVSIPYRTTATSLNSGVNPSNQWTTNSYDSQNRVTAVTTADGAHVNSLYGYSLISGLLGTTVTSSDQMGKTRKGITDGFGRVIRVIEDPDGVAHQTNYTYDVMNNLRKVEQGSQLRYFGYDSLSRVIFVRQVEQTVNTSLPDWTDPVTNYSGGWTAGFTYDNNGNTLTRRDARNITTTFTYDQLNRVTKVRYTNDPQSTPDVNNYYDGYRSDAYTDIPNVKGRAWQNETIEQVRFTVDNFDVMGRPTIQRQQFWSNSAWSSSYQVSVGYDLSGGLVSQKYPSEHTITYETDQLGRLQTFSGNLGDGVPRIYANNFQYNDFGALQQEQFGTQTPLYHKQRYNQRGQLWDMRLSTVSFSSDPANGDRGSIVNYYSNNYSQGGSGTDNNGNLLRQEINVPNGPYFQQNYTYDDLNRLTSVNEKLNGTGADSFKQVYTYDRWGNRSVNWNLSSTNVPRPTYTVDPNTNRLVAPTGYNFGYDHAGNQTNDTYTGGGQRVFDAENHMISAQESSGWQYYKYSGLGLRVRRIVNGEEVWQAYGLGGELLAEYPANVAAAKPQKEYGYRNGQLLITAEPALGTRTNFALATNGGVVSASSTHPTHSLAAINNGDRKGINYGGIWADATSNEYPDSVQIDFNGSKTIDEVALISMQDNYVNPVEPTPTMQGSNYVVSSFRVEYWTESGWQTVPNGLVTGNTYIWRRVTFPALTTTKIKITINATGDNYSQIPEIEVYGYSKTNIALAANGGVASASSTYPAHAIANVNNGDRKGPNHGGIWADNTSWQYPDWVQIDFPANKVVDEVAVFSVQDNGFSSSVEPTQTMTGSQYVVQNFEIWYWNGNDWATTPAMQVTGNNLIWRKVTFPSVLTNKLRIVINSTGDNYSQIPEIEVYGSDPGSVNWLVSDQLGTPRMIVDETGSLANIKRQDFLPFGEEIGGAQVALVGGRTGSHGYVAGNVRQKFTGYEADAETGLNYAQARYQSSVQGRFTGVDPLGASANIADPQSFNRYSYVQNTPLTAVDPTGMALSDIGVYQTDNPKLVDMINRRTTPGPQPRRKNPPLPKPRPAMKPDGHPPPPGGPVSVGPVKVDLGELGEPPPPTVNSISIEVEQPQTIANLKGADGQGFFTGIAGNLVITVRDADGNPITGIRVHETVSSPDRVVIQRERDLELKNGTFTDLVGEGLKPLPKTMVRTSKVLETILQIARTPTTQVTTQTLRFYAPQGHLIGTAVFNRTFSNIDENGQLRPLRDPVTGRFVPNFTLNVGPITYSPR